MSNQTGRRMVPEPIAHPSLLRKLPTNPLKVLLDPSGHPRRYSFGRTSRPGAGEPVDHLINDVKDIIVVDIQTRLEPHEVVTGDLRQPRRTEKGQAQIGMVGVGAVHTRS